MANIISNNNNPNSVNMGRMVGARGAGRLASDHGNPNVNMATPMAGGIAEGSGIRNLRDLSNYLHPVNGVLSSLAPGQCSYDHIIEMIRGLDLQDDGITMNHKIKSIEKDFCNIVQDENMLCDSMSYINDKSLEDGETALKFALLFASRSFDALAMNETKVRTFMLGLLQKNYADADNLRLVDRERLYNSITLLGEYYHRVRLADNSPLTILGESLLNLMVREVSDVSNANDFKLARLVLSQITLNGSLLRNKHSAELSQLLYHIRKNLIEQPDLKSSVKAIMLMTLDLFYSNFESLGSNLEIMYAKYLMMEDESGGDAGNNNPNILSHQAVQPQYTDSSSSLPGWNHDYSNAYTHPGEEVNQRSSSNNTSYENGDSGNVNDEKWPNQQGEDSLEECDLRVSGASSSNSNGAKLQARSESNSRRDNDTERNSRNSRRSYQPRHSPRPLNQNSNRATESQQQQNSRDSQNSGNEERDESKPLPRWRAPRFNRDDQQKDSHGRMGQRRFSASVDDDRQSIRSEGGSIRLYSVNDRLKYAQEKIERSGSQASYTGIANSNWDRQSQRDDRSERSYMSNYERGNNHRRGGRHYNQRQMYDKPPRFQKNNNKGGGGGGSNQGDKIHSETWRRSNSNLKYYDENNAFNGPESNSRSSSRARTLPRPAKSRIDGGTNNSYRRSQSPNSYNRGGGGGNGGGGRNGNGGNGQHYNNHSHNKNNKSRNFNNRYSSQSSLASEASSTFDRQHHQRNRSFSRRNHTSAMQPQQQNHQHQPPPPPQQLVPPSPRKEKENEDDWTDNEATNSELVRNARQTTDYMNYLSSK